ncbi:ABC transporter substrate-binding protein [Ideonella sp.]|uniref:ABC transporter substrate-binding protein n=1 Tax=Ideonella sp. TaxID=1929293 RepID=UPI0035AD8144
MSRVLTWVAGAAAVVMMFGASAASARTVDAIKKAGTIVVATEGQYAPFNFFEGSKLSGFEVDVMEGVAKKMGLKIEWKTLGFDALLTGLGQDRWDLVIASHGITEERAKAVTFTDPHYCSGGAIVTKNAALRTAKDLAGKTIAVQTGSSYLEAAQKIPGVKEVKNFPKDPDAQAAVMSDRADAWVTDKFVVMDVLKNNKNTGLRATGMLFVEKIAAAVAKGNDGLAGAYNKALGEFMAKGGGYEALSMKYFGEDVRCK